LILQTFRVVQPAQRALSHNSSLGSVKTGFVPRTRNLIQRVKRITVAVVSHFADGGNLSSMFELFGFQRVMLLPIRLETRELL
jgi:hypothetical protein